MGKIIGMSPLESFVFYRRLSEGKEFASKLYDLLISQTFFCSMVQDFNFYATTYTPGLFQCTYQQAFERLLGRIVYYLEVCTSANDVTRDNFADAVQCGNAAQLKPEIYDLLVKLQNQVSGFRNLQPSLEQVQRIQETLKQIVDLAGMYDAQASSKD